MPTYQSPWLRVYHTGQFVFETLNNRNVTSDVEVRYRGGPDMESYDSAKFGVSERILKTSAVAGSLGPNNTLSATSQYSDPPPNDTETIAGKDVRVYLECSGSSDVTVEYDGSQFQISPGTGKVVDVNSPTTFTATGFVDGETRQVDLFAVEGRTYFQTNDEDSVETKDPEVSFNGSTVVFQGTYTADNSSPNYDDGVSDASPWRVAGSLQDGTNTFSFNFPKYYITDGEKRNREGQIQIRYDYKVAPTPIGYMAIGQQDGTRTLLPLADPNDSALVYNDERVPLSDGTIAAEDLVDPSDPDATNVRVVRSDGSIAAWRRDNFGGSP
jgi:hypothetical protein